MDHARIIEGELKNQTSVILVSYKKKFFFLWPFFFFFANVDFIFCVLAIKWESIR